MLNFDVFKNNKYIHEYYEVIGEWEVWIDYQRIKIKVSKNQDGKYTYKCSHHYHGSDQASPYISSVTSVETTELALSRAVKELTSFYDPNDEKAKWVESSTY